jgi:type IV pilus assembly protein PilQ
VAASDDGPQNRLERVEVQEDEGSTSIRLVHRSRPTFTVFKLADPPRLVVDVVDTEVRHLAPEVRVGNGVVDRIRLGQQDDGGRVVGRVVIGFDREASYDIKTDGAVVAILIDGVGRTGPQAAVVAAQAEHRELERTIARQKALLAELETARIKEQALHQQARLAHSTEEVLVDQVVAKRKEAERLYADAMRKADQLAGELGALQRAQKLGETRVAQFAEAAAAELKRKQAAAEERAKAEELARLAAQATRDEQARLASLKVMAERDAEQQKAAATEALAAASRERAAAELAEAQTKAEAARVGGLTRELASKDAALEEARKALAATQGALEDAREAHGHAVRRLEEAEVATKRLESERLAAAERALSEARRRIRLLEEAAAQSDATEKNRARELQAEADAARTGLATLEQKLTSSRSELQEVKRQAGVEEARVALVRGQLERAESDLARLQAAREQAEASLEKTDRARAEAEKVAHLAAERARLAEDRAKLSEQKAADAERRGEAARVRMAALTGDASQLERRVMEGEAELALLEKKRAEAESTVARAERDTAERLRAAAAEEQKARDAQRAAAEARTALGTATLRARQERSQAADKRVQEAQARVADAEQSAKTAEAALTTAKREATQAAEKLERAGREAQARAAKAEARAADAEKAQAASAAELQLAVKRAQIAEERAGSVSAAELQLAAKRAEAEKVAHLAAERARLAEDRAKLSEQKAADAERRGEAARVRMAALTGDASQLERRVMEGEAELALLEKKRAEAESTVARAERDTAERLRAAAAEEQKARDAQRAAAEARTALGTATLRARQERSQAADKRVQEAQARVADAEQSAKTAEAALTTAKREATQAAEKLERAGREAQARAAKAEARAADAEKAQAASAAELQLAVKRAQISEERARSVEVELVAATRPTPSPKPSATAAPARPPAAARPVLRDVRFSSQGEVAELRLLLTGPVPYEVVRHDDRRIELRLSGTSLPSMLERALDTSEHQSPVKLVSSFRSATDEGAVRVVVDLKERASADVKRVGSDLVWSFRPASHGHASAPPEPGVRQTPGRRAPPGVTSYPGAAAEEGGAVTAGTTEGTLKLMQGRRTKAKKQYTGKKINLTIKDADIRHVLTFLAKEGGVNIVASEKVKGTITFHLENIPWDLALDMILKTQSYDYVKEAGVYRVAPAEDIASEFEQEIKKKQSFSQLKPMVVRFITVNYANLTDLEKHVQSVLTKNGTISVDTSTSTLIVKDIEEHVQAAEDVVRRLDVQLPQVLIEARIVEATTNFQREFGIQWGGNFTMAPAFGNPTGLAFPSILGVSGASEGGSTTGLLTSSPNYAVNLPAAAGSGTGGALGLTLGSLGGAGNINLRISAAESQGTVKVISAPKILTIDGQKALIRQGISIPVPVVSANGVNTEFFDAELRLEVMTTSSPDGNIRMSVRITKNEPDFGNRAANGAPSILRKEAQTQLLVRDGETTVIGGIYTRNTGDNASGIPGLMDIPILGWFFKNRRETDNRSELLIFMTPRITNRRASVVQTTGGGP